MPEDVRLVKNSPLSFSHNSESLATLDHSKKNKKKLYVTLARSIIVKQKSDRTAKSEKRFWFFTTLIVFVITYII